VGRIGPVAPGAVAVALEAAATVARAAVEASLEDGVTRNRSRHLHDQRLG